MSDITIPASIISNLPTATITGSNDEFPIITTCNAMPKCNICLNIPNNPVTICNKKQLKITDRHLLCLECAKQYTTKNCPICKDNSILDTENNSEPTFVFDKQADDFIKAILDSSLFVCSNKCGSFIAKKDLTEHLNNCKYDANTATTGVLESTSLVKDCTITMTSGKSYFLPMPPYIHDKLKEEHAYKYLFRMSSDPFTQENIFNTDDDLHPINCDVYELSKSDVVIGDNDLNISTIFLDIAKDSGEITLCCKDIKKLSAVNSNVVNPSNIKLREAYYVRDKPRYRNILKNKVVYSLQYILYYQQIHLLCIYLNFALVK